MLFTDTNLFDIYHLELKIKVVEVCYRTYAVRVGHAIWNREVAGKLVTESNRLY